MTNSPRGGVQVRNLTWTPFASAEPLLDDINLTIAPGERVLLVGPSGSGKSTLLRAIAGLLDETESGELIGEVVADQTGLLLQDPNDSLVSDTVYREVAFGLENLGFAPDLMPAKASAELAAVALDKQLGHPSSDLSGGEMQRMALAGVLAMNPDVLLLDEPTSMLDADSAAAVRASVMSTVGQSGATLVVVEHHFEPWLGLVDRILVLNNRGQLIHDGQQSEILCEHLEELLELGLWLPNTAIPKPRTFDLGAKAPGKLTVLTGKSGAGKTTELKRRLREDPLAKSILTGAGYVPQQSELTIVGNTVFESAHLTANLAAQGLQVPEAEAVAHTNRLLKELCVLELADKNPYEISDGEQRRVALATALAHWPMVLYLDEPTVGQDRESWAAIVGAILSARESGVKVTLATHDPDLIALADEIVEIQPNLDEVSPTEVTKVSGLAILFAPMLLLLGSLAVTSISKGLVAISGLAVSAVILGLAGLRIPSAKVFIPGLVAVASVGLSNWYLSVNLDPVAGAVAALRVATFVLPGILLATQVRAISFGDQLAQVLRLPARPVVAAVAAMQRMNVTIGLWDELRFIHQIRGLGVGKSPVSRVREFMRLVFSLLVQSIRGAGTTAVSMDARGFSKPFGGPRGRRTWAAKAARGQLDILVLVLSSLVALAPLLSF
jgi:energy-coupling factor transport system ATP-binding protein